MLLVILGAGASYDCAPWLDDQLDAPIEVRDDASRVPLTVASVRPPLAADLFDGRDAFAQFINDYGPVRPLVATLRRTADDPTALEQQLADYQQAAEDDPAKLYHLMAMRFYLRDVLMLCTEGVLSIQADAGITNHVTLVNTLHAWAVANDEHVCCVSFNYDTVLEQACEDVWRFDRRDLANYTANPHFAITKPHGSVDWQRPFAHKTVIGGRDSSHGRILRAHNAIDRAIEERDLGPIEVAQDPFAPGGDGQRVGIPALAPPLQGKTDFAWPDNQAEHLASHEHQVDRLLVIGWRAAEPHFTDIATATFQGLALPTMIVTGGPQADPEARQVAQNLGLSGPNELDHIDYHTDGFSDLIATGKVGEWLNRT